MKIILLALVLLAASCGTIQPVPTPGASCATVCQRVRELGCSWSNPTPAGVPCEDVCANAQAFGMTWDLACKTNARTCAEASECP
jgi:hypothetical protein